MNQLEQLSPMRQRGSTCSSLALRAKLPNLLTLFFLLLLLAIYARPFADLDFTWQVRTGGEVVQSGKLRVEDSFTYTIAGKQLPDFEWLYEVFLWAVWSVAGYGGLHLLKTLCVLTPLLLVGWRLRREGVGWHAVVASLVVAILVLIPTWNLRPFYCTTIGLLLLSGWLHDHCTGRRALSWEVPLLMLAWANAHPGVITGQGLLAGAIAWEWFNRWLGLNPPLDRAACWRLTLVGGLGLLASLICPGPLERLHYTFNPDLAHPIMRGFVEMQPLYRFALAPPYLAGLTYVVATLVVLTLVRRFRAYRLWEVALLAGLALLANFALRSLQDWLLVMLAVGVPHLTALYRDAVMANFRARSRSGMLHGLFLTERTAKHVLTAPAFRFQRSWVGALLVLLSVFSLTPALASLVPRRHGVDWPVGAVDYIEAHDLRGRFFGNANHGAYLVWRRGPDRALCYVDTRGFFFPPHLLEDSLFVPQLGEDWRNRLRRVLDLGTDYFLLETRGEPGALWRALEGHVEPLYRDTDTVLLRADQMRSWLEPEKKDQ
ncbi:MAG: hypothetical protein HYS12_17020 [Planctomycetes bacterium]|nr:hypothetical protein [Planctomycetota bacterium]